MRSLDRKLGRELRSAWGRLLAITSIIAVGVGCYVEMASIYANLTDAKQRYYARCRMADFTIELKKIPVTELSLLEGLPEITEIRPRIQFFATVDLDGVTELLNGQVLSLPDDRQQTIDDIVLRRGSYFTTRRQNEVIVNDAFARRHKLRPGSWIHLILNNRRQELFVVGTAISSEFLYLMSPGSITPDSEHFGVFYLKRGYAEEVFDFDGAANQVLGRLQPSMRERPGDVLRRAENLLEPYGVLSTTPLKDQPSNRFITEDMKGLATFTTILPAIFLAVAAIVLNILMSRWTEQQRTVVGTLKAIGYRDGEVFAHFIKFGLTIGVLGGLAGCVLGYVLAGYATGLLVQFYEFPNLENQFYLDKSLIGMLISLSCALAGALHGGYTVLKLRPAEAMRPKPPRAGGAIWLERITWFWALLGFGWRMVLRGMVRSRLRTAAGLFASMMGTCILVTGFNMQEAMRELIDFQFERVQRYDLELTFKDERGIEALWEARGLPGVDYAEPVLNVGCTFTNGPYSRRGGVIGLIPRARLTIPRDQAGRRLRIPSVGLVMSRKMAQALHLKRGDQVNIRPTKGLRRPIMAPVVSLADGYLGMSVYADIKYLNRLIGEESAVNSVQLQVDGSARRKRDMYAELKQLPGVQSVYARADTAANLEETLIKTQSTFIYILVLFAGVIFFGSVLNASLISLAERQTEVGTLRVLGYGPWEVGGLFFRESMLANLLGTLIGLPAGYYLSQAMARLYDTELFRIPIVFSWEIVFNTLLLSLAFGASAHLFVQWTIHRMNWLDSLKVKE